MAESTSNVESLAWHREDFKTFVWLREAVKTALISHVVCLDENTTEGRANRSIAKCSLSRETDLMIALHRDQNAAPTEWHLGSNIESLEKHILHLECLQALTESSDTDTSSTHSAEYESTRRTLLNERILLARFVCAFGSPDKLTKDLADVPLRGVPPITPPGPGSTASKDTMAANEKAKPSAEEGGTESLTSTYDSSPKTEILEKAMALMSRAVEAMEAATRKRPREDDDEVEVKRRIKVVIIDGNNQERDDKEEGNNGESSAAAIKKLVAVEPLSAAAHRELAHTVALSTLMGHMGWNEVEVNELNANVKGIKKNREAALKVLKPANEKMDV